MLCGAWRAPSGSIRNSDCGKRPLARPAGHRPAGIISFPIAPGRNGIFPNAIMDARFFQNKDYRGPARCGLAGIWGGAGKPRESAPETRARASDLRKAMGRGLFRKPPSGRGRLPAPPHLEELGFSPGRRFRGTAARGYPVSRPGRAVFMTNLNGYSGGFHPAALSGGFVRRLRPAACALLSGAAIPRTACGGVFPPGGGGDHAKRFQVREPGPPDCRPALNFPIFSGERQPGIGFPFQTWDYGPGRIRVT